MAITEKRKKMQTEEEPEEEGGGGRHHQRPASKTVRRDGAVSAAAAGTLEKNVDIISQLPDEILHSIISRLTLRDGVRSMVLSSRWKHLFYSYLIQSQKELFLDCVNMFDSHRCFTVRAKDCPCRCDDYRDRFFKAVDQFLDFFARRILSYGACKVNFFEVCFCFGSAFAVQIIRWVDFAVRDLRVEDFRLCLLCRGSNFRNVYEDWPLSQGNCKFVIHSSTWYRVTSLFSYNLESLHLISCRLGPDFFPKQQHQPGSRRLKTLSLTHVPLENYDVGGMLSCLVNVESLTFFHCFMPEKLCLNSMHSLKSLEISFCPGMKELRMLDNVNLTTFGYQNDGAMWDFVGTPNLKKWISTVDASGARSFFANASRNLPLVDIVSLASNADLFQCLPDQMPTFSSVTELTLCFERNVRFDVFKMVSLLRAYPNLRRLRLRVDHAEDVEQVNVRSCVHVIQHLKVVEMFNFRATLSVVKFAVYLLRRAVSLKRLILRTCWSPPYDSKLCSGDLHKISVMQKLAKGVDLVVIQ